MPKVMIIYDSKTGNTELMANAIAEGVRSVKGTEAQLLKIGTKFSISILKDASAVIVGSPAMYGSITRSLAEFFAGLKYLKEAKLLVLTGKKGAAFGSYGWDRGWNMRFIEDELKVLGVEIIVPGVSASEQSTMSPMRIHTDDLRKCRELGVSVAKAVSGRLR